jgi:ATP-binding cassette, subfamily B (MDR/TAP), member 1
MFICTFIYMCIWVYTAEVTAKRIRERYLKSILRQDIAFFDNVGPGEVTTRIQTDTRPWFSYHPLYIRNIDAV